MGAAPCQPPRGQEADDIHQSVPADFDEADLENDGIDLWVNEHWVLRLGTRSV